MEQKRDFTLLIASFLLVPLVCLCVVWKFGTLAEASAPKPSKADIQNLEDIKANQWRIMESEAWNRAEVENLAKNGWQVTWNDDPNLLKLVPFTE